MNIEARKISLIQEFLNINNEKLISALENFISKNKSEYFENNLKPMSLEQFNAEIDLALKDEKEGRIIKATELSEKIQKWN